MHSIARHPMIQIHRQVLCGNLRHVHLETDRTITQEVTRADRHWKIKVTI